MKKISLAIVCTLLLLPAFAQDITGAWYGKLNIQGKKLAIVFHLTKQGNTYTATMDSPDQGASGLPTDKTTFVDLTLTVTMAKMGITYTGYYQADSNRITGTFTQGSASLPLALSRDKAAIGALAEPQPKRPQDPVDFPYSREAVAFENKKAGCTLAGTLTMPKTGKPSKVVILITGSGPQNRDEEISAFNHRPFLVWADWLTRQGIGVLRYDDRGIARSTGNFTAGTTADFADDAEAALQYLRSRPDMAGVSVGLMGHSEGGAIAPIVATRNSSSVGFIILLAGPGTPSAQLLLRQVDDQNRLAHTPAEITAISHDISVHAFEYLNTHQQENTDALKAGLSKLLLDSLSKYPPSAFGGATANDIVQDQIGRLTNPWFRYFITFDPAVYLQKTICPVLALNGTLDMQVNAEENLAGIKKALAKAGNKHATITALEGMNHLLQKATTGSVEEYGSIDETINPLALKTVSTWITRL